jgi:hypothetical protein
MQNIQADITMKTNYNRVTSTFLYMTYHMIHGNLWNIIQKENKNDN